MTNEELIEVIRQEVPLGEGAALEGPGGIEQMAATLREISDPDFVTVMVAESGVPQDYTGIEGFRDALGDWISPYERFQLVIDEALFGEDKILFLARQSGTTKHAGVEIETRSATLWALDGGRVVQTTFYLDQAAALRAFGVDPDKR